VSTIGSPNRMTARPATNDAIRVNSGSVMMFSFLYYQRCGYGTALWIEYSAAISLAPYLRREHPHTTPIQPHLSINLWGHRWGNFWLRVGQIPHAAP
jgi:hypothetical protein